MQAGSTKICLFLHSLPTFCNWEQILNMKKIYVVFKRLLALHHAKNLNYLSPPFFFFLNEI